MAGLFLSVAEALAPLRADVAGRLRESQTAVAAAEQALAGGTVSCFIALGAEGSDAVLHAAASSDPALLTDASPLLATSWTDGWGETSVLSDRAGRLCHATAARTGVSVRSADALLGLVEPLVLAAIRASGAASDAAGLRSYLRTLEPEATRLSPLTSGHAEVLQPDLFDAVEPARTSRWVWQLWLLVAALAAVLLIGLAFF